MKNDAVVMPQWVACDMDEACPRRVGFTFANDDAAYAYYLAIRKEPSMGSKTIELDIPDTAPERAARLLMIAEVESLRDAVVDAAVEWHLAGREGAEWFDKAEVLSAAIDSLLVLRDKPCVQLDIAHALSCPARYLPSYRNDPEAVALCNCAGVPAAFTYCPICGTAVSRDVTPHVDAYRCMKPSCGWGAVHSLLADPVNSPNRTKGTR